MPFPWRESDDTNDDDVLLFQHGILLSREVKYRSFFFFFHPEEWSRIPFYLLYIIGTTTIGYTVRNRI